jgi:hypothetical protein
MHQEHAGLNGSEALILYKLGRLEVTTETTQRDVRVLTKRLDTMERRPPSSLKQKAGDIAPYLTGLVVIALATAGKWAELGKFLHGFAK